MYQMNQGWKRECLTDLDDHKYAPQTLKIGGDVTYRNCIQFGVRSLLMIVLKKMDKMNLLSLLIFTAKLFIAMCNSLDLVMNLSLCFLSNSEIIADNQAF